MARWLLKSDPDTEYSWERQVKAKALNWDGVRNAQAQGYLKRMKKGELCFFYHSGKEKRIVGIVAVARAAYPDPSDRTGTCVQVDVKAVKALAMPVTLGQIKSERTLSHLALVRQPRLSVSPVDDAAFARILDLARTDL